MLGFFAIGAGILFTGSGLARRVFSDDGDRIERYVAGAIIGISLWIASNWILATSLAFTRRNLLIVAALFIVGGAASLRRSAPRRVRGWNAAAALLIAVWCVFILWRGVIVPPLSDDAMTYHLPKAVIIIQNQGWTRIDSPDARLRSFPANYELLLADVLLLSGSDALTEWISLPFYLLLLAEAAMIARRQWGSGLHVTACVLATAGAPLLLLHSGAHKNDLITAAFSAGALFWSARWCAQRATPAFILAVLCGSLAIGTKMTAATVVVALVPFVLATLISSPPPLLAMLKGVVFVAISLLLLGGWVYMMNATAPAASPYAAVAAAGAPAGYGDWRNLWELPLAVMQVSAGFTTPWPWSKYNIYKSHFGALFSIAVIALPFCVWRYRRVAGRDSVISLAAAVLAFGLILPAVHPPAEGTAILRYAAFILPFVLAWTVAPVAREQRRYAVPILSLLIALFVWQSVDVAINDTFAPFDYVVDSASRGVPPVASRSHAAYQLDRMAGATDTVAAYGPTVWLYPAYGANFTRHVTHVPTAATASAVPRHAQWVLIDWLPSTARHPSAEELAFYNDMRRDSRFALAYRDEYRNQAIFRRLR